MRIVLPLFISFILHGFCMKAQVKNDPCFDLVKDGLFTNLICNPQGFQEISCLQDWYNPSYSNPNIIFHPSIVGGNHAGTFGIGETPYSPTNTDVYVGLGIAAPLSGAVPKVSYIGTNLREPLTVGKSYSLEFYIGSAGDGYEGGDFIGNLSLLGCESCSMPINNTGCLEQDLLILGKKSFSLSAGSWFSNKLSITFTAQESITKIVIGPGCSPWPTGDYDGVYYLLLDGICLVENGGSNYVDHQYNSIATITLSSKKTKFCYKNGIISQSSRSCNDCTSSCVSIQLIGNKIKANLQEQVDVNVNSLSQYLQSKKRPFSTQAFILSDGSVVESRSRNISKPGSMRRFKNARKVNIKMSR